MPQMTGDEYREFLTAGTRTAKLATSREDGRPHVVYCREIETSIEGAAYRMRTPKPEIRFFDAKSAGCWINA